MTAEGHLLFSVACAIFAKKAELTPELAHGDWWHIIPAALLTALLPDIDHPQSLLGRRLRWLSLPIARVFGHRGFTHSFLAIICSIALFHFTVSTHWILPVAVLQSMIVGYLSHLLADMLTPAGVPLFWPYRWRFRFPLLKPQPGNPSERIFCMVLIVGVIFWDPALPLADLITQWRDKIHI